MKKNQPQKSVWIILMTLLTIGLLSSDLKAEDKNQKPLAAAEKWLQLVDSGEYAQSWKAAAGYFQGAVGKDQWRTALSATRKPLGQVISRRLAGAKYYNSLPGAPDGEYVVIQYQTRFNHKAQAVETVTPMMDKDGQWRVSGYYIK